MVVGWLLFARVVFEPLTRMHRLPMLPPLFGPQPLVVEPRACNLAILALRAEARKCEARVEKIEEMRAKLATKLADPALYEDTRAGELDTWNKKYAEVMEGLHRAEALWEAALEKLEAAETA